MDFTIPLKPAEVKLADSLQAKLELRDISLFRCEVDGAGPPVANVEPVRLRAEFDSELSLNETSGVEYEVTLRVDCDDTLVFHIHSTFLARYRFKIPSDKASKRELQAFRKSYAVIAAWPYLREFVHSMTGKMGLPTEPLPLLRLARTEAKDKKG